MADLSRRERALLALRAMPNDEATPVQAVKMLFLLEKKVVHGIGEAKFNFVPYDYGPFDSDVYVTLDELKRQGLVQVIEGSPRRYRLTEIGQAQADAVIRRLAPAIGQYASALGVWMSRLSFAQLVSAIYKEFPEMRANSIFRG